jgi:regulator of sigma E protease
LLYVIGLTIVILKVAVGLGFVIFVHELGHFAVAKLCGVKCEKFYLGFDFGGLRLCRFRWGETEYGIGIFPLGGYVKMLGQEDNPARLREEMERAKQQAESGGVTNLPSPASGRGSGGEGGQEPSHSALTPALSQKERGPCASPDAPLYDPRSFLAQSVPKRMAIISAGVIMNVIFAFLMAVVAFGIGVEQVPCVIGSVFPGEPAWQAGLRVGDEVLEIAGKKMTQFRDLQTAISLGDIDPEKGVDMLIRRPGVQEPFSVTVKPDRSRGAFLIGVASGKTTRLLENRRTWLVEKRNPVIPGSVAAQAKPPFLNGDQFVGINQTPIDNYAQIDAGLAKTADQKITVAVYRGKHADRKPSLSITVDRNPVRTLGLVMKMGPISAVQADSPATAAGIKAGDLLLKIDDKPIADPMRLPSELARRAGQTVKLTVQREGAAAPVVLSARLREPSSYFAPEYLLIDSPVEVTALGLTYRVLNEIADVVPGSPAAKAELRPGDVMVRALLLPPDKETQRNLEKEQSELTIPFGEKDRNWPALCNALQDVLPGTVVRLTVLREGKERWTALKPVEVADWFSPERGFVFEPMTFARRAQSTREALALGGREMLDALTIVFRTVGKVSTNQVSARNLGGPWSIIQMAMRAADAGTPTFLLFLTFLSANLAVINFLPIPLLDGGLMVFLLYEGIRGKPANEHVQVVLTYLGLAFILGLMFWVMGLDFGLISRR